ncbi:MAG: protein kinase domain-containing protein [Kofleriaceae bacterium]
MSSTPAQKFVCPRCRASYDEPSHFCPECGADMTRASALDAASRGGSPSPSSSDPEGAPLDRRLSDSNQAWLGKIVDGRYRVLEVIGRGGMGVVYRVEHLRMGKIAAMKVLHRDLAHDADVVGRFEREAAAISKLHHPHTVQVFDFGTTQGALYLIMELVRGQDLGRIIERDGPMAWARAAPLLAQICGALQEAHELGIVHRDLKPENVLITRSTAGRDYAKVLDFGLAKLDQRGGAKRETERQQIVGTPYFMAPEQIRGEDVDARTDIYSFGVMMFELLTGKHLYTGSTAVGVLTKHLTAEPDAPSMRAPNMGIPPSVDHLCRKALARDPSLRWQTAAELGAAIEEVYAETVGDATGPRPPGARALRGPLVLDDDDRSNLRLRRSDIDAFERGLRRRNSLVWAGAALVAAGGIGAAAWYLMRPPPTTTVEIEPNDEPAQANRIAPGTQVTGYLGRRRSPTEGDRDHFLVPFPSGRRVVTVTVSGLPNIDVQLSVAGANGLNGATVDEAGIGGGEALHRRAFDGPIVVTVGQTMAPGQRLPVENVSDPYLITVVEEPAEGGEIEPNNLAADATPIELTRELRGHLDTRTDVDLLRWTGAAGTFSVVVRADGLPLQWRVGDGVRRTPGAATVELAPGDLIRIERTDAAKSGSLEGRNAPWSIVIVK